MFLLFTTVFLSSAITLIFELIGARMLAPYLGTSSEVWAGIIATILGGLSLGYWWGGVTADKTAKDSLYNVLARALFGASIAIMVTWAVRDFVLAFFAKLPAVLPLDSLTLTTLGAGIILFVPASIFLGAISPIATKIALHDLAHSARVVGKISALGTVGSIIGTIAASTLLIPFFGTSTLLISLSLCLLLISFSVAPAWKTIFRSVTACIVLICASIFAAHGTSALHLLADIDTQYSRIWLYEFNNQLDGTQMRVVRTDPYGTQCAAYINEDGTMQDKLIFGYTQAFDLASVFMPEPKNIAMIGGCNYSYPTHLLNMFSDATIDVIEIDPGMTAMAEKYFGLSFDPSENADTVRLTAIHKDARMFLNTIAASSTAKYDLVFVDAFNSHSSIPYQLTTQESMQALYDSLSSEGVVAFNMIGAFTGETSELLRAQITTVQSVFPEVRVFKVRNISDTTPQNVLVLAGRSEQFAQQKVSLKALLPGLETFPSTEIAISDIEPGILLTDDYAPTESLGRATRNYTLRSQ